MKECMWVRGAHPAAITPRGVVIMAPGNLELTRQFWQILREGGDLGVIVQKLTASFASDLASLPEFVAIIASGNDLHVAIRGNYELVVQGPQGSQSVTSGSVIMWSEFRFVDIKAWRINTIASDGGFETQPERWSAVDALVPVAIVESGAEYAAVPAELSYGVETVESPVEGTDSAVETNNTAAVDEAEPVAETSPEFETYLESETSPDDSIIPIEEGTDESAWRETRTESGQTIGDTNYFAGFIHDGTEYVSSPQEPEANSAEPVVDEPVEPEFDSTGLETASVEPVVGEPVDPVVAESVDSVEEPWSPAVASETDLESADPELAEPESEEAREAVSRFSQMFSENTIYRDVENAAVRDVRNDDDPFHVQVPLPSLEPETRTVVSNTGESAQRVVRLVSPGGEHSDGGVQPSLSSESLDEQSGDHDGHTIRSTKMDALREKARELVGRSAIDDILDDAPRVLALLCINGHPNPTHAQICRECSGPMSENSVTVPQPNLGALVLSNGVREPLYGEIIIGRQPRIHPAMVDKQRPLLVPSPKKEISRNHCEFRVTGWDVYLRDLGSNNGTFLIRPGQPPLRVSETSPVSVQVGDVIDLGDGLTIRLEK